MCVAILRLICALSLTGIAGQLSADLNLPGKGKKIVVFTDYEADDSVAIGLMLHYLHDQQVSDSQDFMIGALLSNQYRKKALAQILVKLFGYSESIVYAGTGGIKEPFEEEGRSLLPQKQLEEFLLMDNQYLISSDPDLHQDGKSVEELRKILDSAAPNSIDVILLTNPIDFMKAIGNNVVALYKVKSIVMMGGWFALKASFNWTLHIESVIELLHLMNQVKGHPYSPTLTIFSSHFFAAEFNGYVNFTKFPEVIRAFDTHPHPIVSHFRHMVKNWDASMTDIKDHHTDHQKMRRLAMVERIGKDNIGRQFAPADPVTMLGYLYPDFILQKTPCALELTISMDSYGRKDALVRCETDESSNVFIVDKVDIPFFNDKLLSLMSL